MERNAAWVIFAIVSVLLWVVGFEFEFAEDPNEVMNQYKPVCYLEIAYWESETTGQRKDPIYSPEGDIYTCEEFNKISSPPLEVRK